MVCHVFSWHHLLIRGRLRLFHVMGTLTGKRMQVRQQLPTLLFAERTLEAGHGACALGLASKAGLDLVHVLHDPSRM